MRLLCARSLGDSSTALRQTPELPGGHVAGSPRCRDRSQESPSSSAGARETRTTLGRSTATPVSVSTPGSGATDPMRLLTARPGSRARRLRPLPPAAPGRSGSGAAAGLWHAPRPCGQAPPSTPTARPGSARVASGASGATPRRRDALRGVPVRGREAVRLSSAVAARPVMAGASSAGGRPTEAGTRPTSDQVRNRRSGCPGTGDQVAGTANQDGPEHVIRLVRNERSVFPGIRTQIEELPCTFLFPRGGRRRHVIRAAPPCRDELPVTWAVSLMFCSRFVAAAGWCFVGRDRIR